MTTPAEVYELLTAAGFTLISRFQFISHCFATGGTLKDESSTIGGSVGAGEDRLSARDTPHKEASPLKADESVQPWPPVSLKMQSPLGRHT